MTATYDIMVSEANEVSVAKKSSSWPKLFISNFFLRLPREPEKFSILLLVIPKFFVEAGLSGRFNIQLGPQSFHSIMFSKTL